MLEPMPIYELRVEFPSILSDHPCVIGDIIDDTVNGERFLDEAGNESVEDINEKAFLREYELQTVETLKEH